MTISSPSAQFLAFEGHRCLVEGDAESIAAALHQRFADPQRGSLLVFAADSGAQVDLDLSLDPVALGLQLQQIGEASTPVETAVKAETNSDEEQRRGPGRPRLGVVSREITLLPRHWDWLNAQPGGASVSLRKLVDKARRENAGRDRKRLAQDACFRFINTLAGNLPGFEEACRALYADDASRFGEHTADWPSDLGRHARRLAAAALAVKSEPQG